MKQPVSSYTSSSRMADDDYAGVLTSLGQGARLSVNPAGTRYAFQRLRESDAGSFWSGVSYARLSTLIAKQADKVEGLADACKGLPDHPALAAPDLQAARQSVLDAFAATDWRRDDYSLALFSSGSLRVIIVPDGSQYRLQWLCLVDLYSRTDTNNWRTISVAATAPPLIEFIRSKVGDMDLGRFSSCKDADAVAPDLQRFIASLPFRASDFSMPERLERPSTVW